ncbi:hypothetical protein GQ53DRAFT_814532 [Thozetella sp. PMI_491]|nr:hypothetical protein GQ53DRAFT_814532 [Thozetella sp. PMI_491]
MDSPALPFAQFPRFPAEIRLAIWEFSIPDDVPEVYVLSSELDGLSDDSLLGEDGPDGSEENPTPITPDPVRKVLIGIPPILHVCHESRHVAQANLSFLTLDTAGSQVRVPYRLYRPEFDSIFIPQSSFVTFMIGVVETGDQPAESRFYSRIRHLALHSSEIFGGFDELRIMLPRFTALRQISFVFGPSYGDVDTGVNRSDNKRMKHFTLDDWPEVEGHMVHSQRQTAIPIQPVLDHIEEDLALLEVEEGSPWDEETGEWLFKLDAKKLIVHPPRWQS